MANFSINNLPRQVWAYYHPFYGTPKGPSGRWLLWNEPLGLSKGYGLPEYVPPGEVKEHLQHDPNIFLGLGRRSNYSAFYPTLGLYDCLDASILEKHAIRARPNFITVCSFNEWGEGTQIEPCLEYESLYIELTAKWAKTFLKDEKVEHGEIC